MSAPEISTFESSDRLVEHVCSAFLDRLATAQGEGRDPQVCLTGGTIADAFHAHLAAHPDRDRVDWSRVGVWWGDERYVAADSPDRNEGQARSALLDHLALDPARVHAMPAAGDHADVDAAASAYAEEVRAAGGGEFEVVFLGVGPDGHVASLFPGFPQLEVDDAIAVGVTGSPKPPPERVSLTFAALNRTRETWFLASGEGKADAVARALAPDGSLTDTPARGAHGTEATRWFLDSPAASHLPS